MNLKPYKEKLNTPPNSRGAYSIGISKKAPSNSANLGFASAPKITQNNLSVSNEFYDSNNKILYGDHEIYYANNDYLLENANGISDIPSESILLTDEFSIKTNILDPRTNEIIEIIEPRPLYYVATLKNPIKINNAILMNSVPYIYGYDQRTIEQIKIDNQKDDNLELDMSDITPINNSIFLITDEDGKIVDRGYKIRLTRDSSVASDAYQVRIYNSFDKEKTYKVKYAGYNGENTTEILKSNIVFNRLSSVQDLKNFTDKPFDPQNPEQQRFMSNVYAVEPNGISYNVYAPTELYLIDDSQRQPFEYKYRIKANIDIQYSNSNKKVLNIGVLYLNNDVSNDARGIAKALSEEVGGVIPDYLSFINPHPPAKFYKNIKTVEDNFGYFKSDEYWEIDMSSPQHHINDYDLIIITGYGTHNLSAYNEIFKNYLRQGGKLLIDNLSNYPLRVLELNFGDDTPIIDYYYNYMNGYPVLLNEARVFASDGKFKSRHYNLEDVSVNRIGYMEGDALVSPQMILPPYDKASWTDVIKYGSEKPSIGYKTFEERGRIYLSNCGILKAFTSNSNSDSKKFLTNMILAIAEDIWINSPWTYDRVYHIDQLFDDEMEVLNYVYDIGQNNKMIAKKIIAPNVKSLMSKYIDTTLYRFEGRYYIEAIEFKNGEWKPATDILMSGTGSSPLNADDQVWCYAIAGRASFNVDNLHGYSKSDIKVYNEKVTFTFTIRPYTYVWKNKTIKQFAYGDGKELHIGEKYNTSTLVVRKILLNGQVLELVKNIDYTIDADYDVLLVNNIGSGETIEVEYSNGKIFREKLYATGDSISKYTMSISKGDGLKTIGLLSDMIPKIPGDSLWADRNNTFFEAKIGYYDFGVFNEKEQRVNLRIYDKLTGEYKYSSDGENTISYVDLFGYRYVDRGDGTRELRRRADDMVIQASTDYYVLTANKRTFAVKQDSRDVIEIKMPSSINTNENWHPRIKYINFSKNSFDKGDYERWIRTLGFRFEKEYISQRLLEYFGETKEVEREKAAKVNSREFFLEGKNIIEARGVKLETYNESTLKYSNVSKEVYSVDYTNGVISFSVDINSDIYATYVYSDFTHSELGEDRVLSIISKLSDDGAGLSDADKEIISDAFDLMEQDLLFEYDMKEYHKQPWDPLEPLKKSTNEIAKFVDSKTIKVQYPKIHIDSDILDNRIAREQLERISSNMFKSINMNWLETEAISIEYYNSSGGNWILVDPKYYIVDFKRGLITVDTNTTLGQTVSTKALCASYSYSTISIQRKTYTNAIANMEELTRLDAFHYDVANENILGFDVSNLSELDKWAGEGYTIPKLYIKENFNKPVLIEDPTSYEIDYKRGFVRLNFQPSGKVYMSYSYAKSEDLTIVDYDKNLGTIQLEETITFNDNIFVTYLYEDDYYEYKGYMDGDEFIGLDLNPTRGHVSKILTVDNGKILYKDVPTYKLIGETVYFYLMPSKIIKGGKIISENSQTIRHTFDKDSLNLLQLAHPELIVLGSIKLINDYTVYDVDILDTRSRGGGLKPNADDKEILKTDELSQNFWDIVNFDGIQYYGNGITIIRIPDYVLKQNGGSFSKEEVEDIVNKHLALGVLPIIKYYTTGV